jgi:hypothetical protein
MIFRDLCYEKFSRIGVLLSNTFKTTEDDLDAANMRVHPEIYFSVIGFFAISTLIIPLVLTIIYLIGKWPTITSLPLNGLILSLFHFFTISYNINRHNNPKTAASNRITGLKSEIPYASMYISVMASGVYHLMIV